MTKVYHGEGFDKKAYMREYMRKKRAGVSPEPVTLSVEDVQSAVACPEGYNAKMWEYSVERAVRACNYANKFPEHIRPSEVRFQSPEWQYQDQARYPLPMGLLRD